MKNTEFIIRKLQNKSQNKDINYNNSRVILAFLVLLIIVLIPEHFSMTFLKCETKYWLFSASMQTLGAFIALLFTGYTFIYEHLKEHADNEVSEIISMRNHKKIRRLTILVGITISFSLVMLMFNEIGNMPFFEQITILNIVLIIYSLIKGFSFIISVLDPSNEEKIALELIADTFDGIRSNKPKNQEMISRGKFIDEFIELEEFLRNKYEVNEKYQKRPISLRALINKMSYDVIDSNYVEILNEVVVYRNLVVHGKIKNVEKFIYDELVKVKKNIGLNRTGESVDVGSYICSACGQSIIIEDASDILPPCPKCNGNLFTYSD